MAQGSKILKMALVLRKGEKHDNTTRREELGESVSVEKDIHAEQNPMEG